MKTQLKICLFASVLAVPFAATIGQTAPKNPLDGTAWQLLDPTYPGLSERPFLKIADGRLGASVGCNSMGGSYKLDGQKIKVSQLISTMMACDDAKMKAEGAYSDALQNVASYELSSDGKTLKLRGKTPLTFSYTGPFETPKPAPNPDAPVSSEQNFRPQIPQVRINRTVSPEYAGDLMLKVGGREQKIASKVWNFWMLRGGFVAYAGGDGGGGFENEGHSLWLLSPSGVTKKKLIAEVFPIERVREVGDLLILSMRDGGLGAPHLNIIRRDSGKSVYRKTGAYLSAIRNGRLAIAILPYGEAEGPIKRLEYLEIGNL